MNDKINIQELALLLSEKSEMTQKEAENFLKTFFSLVEENLLREKQIKIRHFGTFKLLFTQERESVHVSTGERLVIPAHYKIVFSPDRELSETVNEPFALFESVEINEEAAENIQTDNAGEEEEAEEENTGEEVETTGTIPEAVTSEDQEDGITGIDNEKQEAAKEVPVAEEKKVEIEEKIETKEEKREEISPLQKADSQKAETNGPEQKSREKRKKRRKKKRDRTSWIAPVIIILACLGIASIHFIDRLNPGPQSERKFLKEEKREEATLPETTSLSPEAGIMKEPEIGPKEDTGAEAEATSTIKPDTKQKVTESAKPEKSSNNTEPEIRSTATIKGAKKRTVAAGERLVSLALDEYGEKVFWVYIYEENKERIPNPNKIVPGMELDIPPAEKYKIDKNDPESIRRAKEREAMLN